MDDDQFASRREQLMAEIALGAVLMSDQLGRETFDPRVIEAMTCVPRHEFVPHELQDHAYLNRPLSIGYGKTISNPLIIAVMTDLLRLEPDHQVLEVGTGLGYHAAILSELAGRVYSLEIVDELAQQARRRLRRHARNNIEVISANGANGLPEMAPFDRILVTAAPDLIPPALLNQLKPGGRMIIPAGLEGSQMLYLVTKDAGGRLAVQEILPVGFLPLEGDAPSVAS